MQVRRVQRKEEKIAFRLLKQPESLRLFFFLRLEFERDGIHAISLSGRRRSIRKDVSQVGFAPGAEHLGSVHSERIIGNLDDTVRTDRFEIARPACSGFEF